MLLQSSPTLFDPLGCNLPDFSVHGIFFFFKQEHWSGLLFPLPGDFPDPGVKFESPGSPELQADSFHTESLRKTCFHCSCLYIAGSSSHCSKARTRSKKAQ